MFELRPFSICIFIIIFNLLNIPAGSSNSKKILSSSNLLSDEKIVSKDKNSSFIKPRTEAIAQNNIKSIAKKDNTLSLLGIGATSIVFLLVLRSLFKAEKQLDSHEEDELIQDSTDVVSQNDDPSKTKDIKNKIAKSEDDILVNALSKIHDAGEPTIDSDIMGKLTIVTSSTTEIDIVSELIRDLQHQSNSNDSVRQKDLRRKAIWELGRTNDCRAIEPLIKTITKVDSLEKNLILDTITRIANHSLESINNILLTSLEDERAEVRKNAIQDLTVLYQSVSSISVHLSQMTQDSDREVQQTAKWALEQFKQMSTSVESVESIKIKK